MTLPANGPISMSQIAAEIGISQAGLSLNHGLVRTLAGKSAGAVSFDDLHGQSWSLTFNATPSSIGSTVGVYGLALSWMKGVVSEISAYNNGIGPGSRTSLYLSTPVPVYQGNVKITNNSNGVSVVLPYVPAVGPNPAYWGINTYTANLFGGGGNQSFTITPV